MQICSICYVLISSVHSPVRVLSQFREALCVMCSKVNKLHNMSTAPQQQTPLEPKRTFCMLTITLKTFHDLQLMLN